MLLEEIGFAFNRALTKTFSRKKLLLVFVTLAFCGICVVFSRGLALHAGYWITLSLSFIPVFLCSGVLLALGILLVSIYHDEIKRKSVSYSRVFAKSWEMLIGAVYFSIPLILSYLLLWMLLGIFVLLSKIPSVGDFFAATLSFAPFLLNLGALLLCVLALLMLFFVAPVVALKGLHRAQVTQIIAKRFRTDLFSNLLLGIIAIMPLVFMIGILSLAVLVSGGICSSCEDPLSTVLQWFFMMIPFTALLAPVVIFFFNFAAEAHVMTQKALRAPVSLHSGRGKGAP